MPRKYIKKSDRCSWTQKQLTDAINAVRKHNVPIREAARNQSIPERTLRRRLQTGKHEKQRAGPMSTRFGDRKKNLKQTNL